MAVVNTKQKWTGQGSGRSKDGRNGKRTFTVLLDGEDPPEVGPVIAREAAGLPRIGDPFPGDGWLRCVSVGPGKAITPTMFEFEVTYDRRHLGSDPEVESPLDQPVKRSWSTQNRSEPFDRDVRTGNPIVNAVGDPFDPPLQRPVAVDVLVMTRNVDDYDAERMRGFKNHTNESEFWGKDADQVYCADISAEELFEGQWHYWRERFEFHMIAEDDDSKAPLEWSARLLNQGLRHWTGKNVTVDDKEIKEIVAVTDVNGNPVSEPVRLASDGKLLAVDGNVNKAVFLIFNRYVQADFDALGLPTGR